VLRTVRVVSEQEKVTVKLPAPRASAPSGVRRPLKRSDWRNSKAVARASNSIRGQRERGDVPGWVLITLMSAGLVVALWAIAGPALEGLFNEAISQISRQAS
jgi:hypothetical protein